MTQDLEPRRRALAVFYHRYLAADRAFRLARREALSWFPSGSRPAVTPIGNPGSPIRRLHDRRDRALQQLIVARTILDEARRQSAPRTQVRLIVHGRLAHQPS
jgi:hypothetical protein